MTGADYDMLGMERGHVLRWTEILNTHVDRPGKYKVVKKTKFKDGWALSSNPVGTIDADEHVIIKEILEVDGRIRGKTSQND